MARPAANWACSSVRSASTATPTWISSRPCARTAATPQRIIKNLGRKEAVIASGGLERLASSVARYAERAVVLSQIEAGNPAGLACKRIGAPLLFGRLWEETGCRAVVEDLLVGRGFEFPVERAILATVLHRIMVSGSRSE